MKTEEIFKTMDSNIKRNKDELIEYARTIRDRSHRKYKYYTQFIFEEYKTRSAESIREEIEATGIKSVSSQQIWNIKHKITNYIEEKKPQRKGVKYCVRCEVRPIPDHNKMFCLQCQRDNNKRSTSEPVHNGGMQYV